MIEPLRCLIMVRATTWLMRKAEVRLMRRTFSQSATGMRKMSPSRVMPALFTSTSTLPSSAMICSIAGPISSALDTSALLKETRPPAAAAACSISREGLARVEVDEHDARALAEEIHDDFLPDSPGAPGHDCVLSLQQHVHPPIIQRRSSSFAISSPLARRRAARLRPQRTHQPREDRPRPRLAEPGRTRRRRGSPRTVTQRTMETTCRTHSSFASAPDADRPARHVRVYSRSRVRERVAREGIRERLRRPLHQRAVEGPRDLQPDEPLRPRLLEGGLGLRQPRCRPRQDDLPGAVVVGEVHPRLGERLHDRGHGFGMQAEHRGHPRLSRTPNRAPGRPPP